jgi:sugar O-acyltransferase (sialic acid O-acetyltransferase NeuD family)
MKTPTALILLGGGGHAAVVAEAAIGAGWDALGYLDDAPPLEGGAGPAGLTRLGAIADLSSVVARHRAVAIHAAVGEATLRRAWLDSGAELTRATIIHRTAVISPSATIDEGVFIGPGAVINARARIDRGVIINTGAIIEHDCIIEPFCHVAPGAVLAGAVRVGAESLIGVRAAVGPGLTIGRRVTLGAGAVAVADIDDGCQAVGVPARPADAASPAASS